MFREANQDDDHMLHLAYAAYTQLHCWLEAVRSAHELCEPTADSQEATQSEDGSSNSRTRKIF